jgi:glutathione peroxidase
MEMRFTFTGLVPCGEHTFWCGPWFGFTGKICTPSIAEKICFRLRGKIDSNIRQRGAASLPGAPARASAAAPRSPKIILFLNNPAAARCSGRTQASPRIPQKFRLGGTHHTVYRTIPQLRPLRRPEQLPHAAFCSIPYNRNSASPPALLRRFCLMPPDSTGLYGFSPPLLDGCELSLRTFAGQVLLIVNTASHCGFTPQYGGLEALHLAYRERGFTVLAFPCNQFGAQEPGSASEIASFCQRNYGVSFPVFAKIEVNGPRTHPLYRFLKSQKRGILGWIGGGRIHWNFTKFLIERSGKVAARYGPATKPQKLTAAIERLLAQH